MRKFATNILLNNSVIMVCLVIGLALCISVFGMSHSASAVECPDGSQANRIEECTTAPSTGADVSESSFTETKLDVECESSSLNRDCPIVDLIVVGINFLAAVAGIVFVASIMISGFQYMTGRDNSGQIEKAKARIVQTLIALALFIFMYALLEFLVPGGILPV